MLRNKIFWLGLIGLIICHLAIILKWQPIKEWFYVAVWWSYILFIDGIIYKIKGNSLIISRTKSFFLMLPWSVAIWLVFELFNVRLQNWYYASMTPVLLERWSGYFIAFATVLPGIFETTELLEVLGIFRSGNLSVNQADNLKQGRVYLIIGIILFILPVILPQYFFTVVWLSFIFLLEPINYRLTKKDAVATFGGLRSPLEVFSGTSFSKSSFVTTLLTGQGGLLFRKDWGTIFRLSFAGLICGVLWEVWNWFALAHWVYALPYFHYLQIFQMPVLGYLGFLPFAWECYLMYEFAVINGWSRSWQDTKQEKKIQTKYLIIVYLLLVIFILGAFSLIDNFTVRSFVER